MSGGVYCDLHMHSTHSDGTDEPRRLVAMAAEKGLGAIAVTDHDTTSAVEEAQAAGRELGVQVLSGVEISVEHHGRTVHLLGYCFDSGVERLRAGLAALLEGRNVRNRCIVQKLNDLGIAVTYEDVVAESGGPVVGRPHFAAALLKCGAVSSIQEAFDQYLGAGGRAYVDRLQFSLKDAVAMVREAGGVAVLAHPKFVRLGPDEQIEMLVKSLADAGMGGLECYYSNHSPEETSAFLRMAEKYNLVATGGSDFHGANKPELSLGTGRGDLRVPIQCAERLVERAGQG